MLNHSVSTAGFVKSIIEMFKYFEATIFSIREFQSSMIIQIHVLKL